LRTGLVDQVALREVLKLLGKVPATADCGGNFIRITPGDSEGDAGWNGCHGGAKVRR